MAAPTSDSTPKFDNIQESPDAAEGAPSNYVFEPRAATPEAVHNPEEGLPPAEKDVAERNFAYDDSPTEMMLPRQPGMDYGRPEADSVDDQTVKLPAASAASIEATPSPATADQADVPAPPRRAGSEPRRGPGSLLLVLLLSYASAVTIALIYVLATRGGGDPPLHQLENLRDPVEEEGTVRIQQRDVEMPPGHTLALSQSRRFGNIVVEPLRVTYGPLEFVHFSGDPRSTQPPSPPVLKLWLRFTNVSEHQTIAPLDALLAYKRAMNASGELVSNAFLVEQDQKAAGPIVFTYPLAQNSEWDLKGQRLGDELQPGESLETFIPSDPEGLDQLSGTLLWRVHFRKGYADTGRGVTTLVEVEFDRSDVQEETERPSLSDHGATGQLRSEPRRNRKSAKAV
jgi:hypothetical protein